MFKSRTTIFMILIALILLVCIRAFESQLFYDPFIAFFKSEFHHKRVPFFYEGKLFANLLFRYLLNTTISLVIIYYLFKEKQLVQLSFYLYTVLFFVLISIYYAYLNISKNPDLMLLFYIRRFLIQPIFLVLFIPAFFYQKQSK